MIRNIVNLFCPYTVNGYMTPLVSGIEVCCDKSGSMGIQATYGNLHLEWTRGFFTRRGMEKFLQIGKSPVSSESYPRTVPDFSVMKRSTDKKTVDVFDNLAQLLFED